MKYFVIILSHYIFFMLTLGGSEKSCQKKEDCSEQLENQVCSLCVGNEGSLKCVYPFPDIYLSSETNHKCEFVISCGKNPCKNGGRCTRPNIGRGYICVCAGNYFGKDCELRHESKLSTSKVHGGYYYSIVGKLRASAEFKNKIVFKSSETISKQLPTLIVVTNEGYFNLFMKNTKQETTVYEASIIYPFKAYKEGESFLVFRNAVLGYITTLQVRGYDRMTEVFRNSFQIFVSYENIELNCMPAIKLKNCGTAIDAATGYVRKSEIILKVEKDLLPEGNLKKQIDEDLNSDCDRKNIIPVIDLTWEVFLVDNSDNNSDKNITISTKLVHKDTSVLFKPFDIEFGLYWVTTKAKIVRENKKSQTTAYCFFKVDSLPLEPNIEKGSKRFISSREEGLVMSAKNSKDPNVPDSKKTTHSLITKWSCTSDLPKSVTKHICEPKILKSFEPYIIPSDKIPNKVQFNFTLELWSDLYDNCVTKYCYEAKKHRFSYQVVIIDFLKDSRSFLDMMCLQNCLDKMLIYEVLVLKVKVMNTKVSLSNVTYKWTYSKTGSTEIISWTGHPGLNSYIFYLDNNSLEPGFEYTVNVTAVVGSSQLYSLYSFETDTVSYSGACTIEPEEGVKGQSYFDITCNRSEKITFTFEFNDVTFEEAEKGCKLNGRMLGISHDGILSKVILTRGTVSICISYYGFKTSKNLTVQLLEPKEEYDMENYIKQLTFYIKIGASLRTLQYISLIADMSIKPFCKIDFFRVLLEGIRHTSLKTAEELKIHLVTLYNVLSKMHQLELYFSDINFMVITKETIFNLSKCFSDLKDMFIYREIKQISQLILNSLLLSSKLENKLPLKFSLNELDIKSLYVISQSFMMVEETLDNIKNVVTYIQMPGLLPTRIVSDNDSLVVWALKDDPSYDNNLLNMFQEISDTPVVMTVDLYKSLQNTILWEGNLICCVTVMKENFIHQFSNDLTSNLLYLSLGKSGLDFDTLIEKEADIKILESPIETIMTIDGSPIQQIESGVVTQLDPNMEDEKLDLLIKTYRLDPEPSSLMEITFLYPPLNGSLRVLITKDYRPAFEIILKKHQQINETNPTYSFSCSDSDNEEKSFYYMTILPGPEVPINKSVGYSFTMNNTVCKSWSRLKWSSAGCGVSDKTRGNKVHCQCTHLSIFEAISPYLPNKIDPFSDAKLFLTVLDNPLVVGIILTILIFYLIICVWAYQMDKKDRLGGIITVLEDNFPGDSNAYLLAVFTSSRLFAGTSANVGIQLEGEGGSSRAHILKSRYHRVLTRDSDSWFLIFSPKSLGLIQRLHIWHDNSGYFPNWYCNDIHVYDLKERMETIFIVDQWLELRDENYPEAVLLPATPSDVLSPRRLFFSNIVGGMKSKQSLGGVFTKHPRSTVSRVQLLNVAMCALMIALMCSIMFYEDSEEKPDDFAFDITYKEVIISVVALIVTAVFNCIIGWEFGKSYEFAFEKNVGSSLCLRGSDHEEYFYSQLRRSRAFHKKHGKQDIIVNTFKKVLNPTTLAPAKLASGKPVVRTVTVWLMIAWFTSIVVIFSCMYITMLYGLKLGLVKSKKWITSVCLSFVEDSFFVTPLLLITSAVLLTTIFDVLMTTNTYQLTPSDVLSSSPQDRSDEYINKLCKIRSHPMYFPPTDQMRIKALIKSERVNNWIHILQFIVSLVFVFVVNNLVHSLWSSQYYLNSHLAKFIILPRFSNIGFFEAQNTSEVNRYIETTFLQALYTSRWYNGQPHSINENPEILFWTSDFSWKMFGLPSLRQLRVKAESCSNMVVANISCIPPWSSSSEDNDDYNVGWLPLSWSETSVDKSPWRYTPPSSSWFNTMYRLTGPSGTIYDNGGFICQLHPSAKETLGIVSDLVQNSWQDHFTKAVFMELTLCHTNSRILSKITLITEYLVSSWTLKANDVHSAIECTPLNSWNVTFIVIVFIFFLELCLKINREGFACTLKRLRNLVLLILVVLGFIFIAMISVDFVQCILYDFDERHEFSITSSTCRAVGLFKGGKTLAVCYRVLALSLRTIVWLQLLALFFFVCTWEIFYQSNIVIWCSFTELIAYKKRMAPLDVGHLTTVMSILVVVKFILSTIIISLFLIVFIYYKETTRSEETLCFSFINFLNNEMKRISSIIKN